jgi:hypothetical protein
MKSEDEFVAWITGAVLRGAGEEIQAIYLEDIVNQAYAGENLDTVVARSMKLERQPGDFGMEIIGPLLVPVLIEVGKQFWSAYLKNLTEKAADKLADATIAEIKASIRTTWSGAKRHDMSRYFAELIRATGERYGLDPSEIDKLITAIQNESFADELQAD